MERMLKMLFHSLKQVYKKKKKTGRHNYEIIYLIILTMWLCKPHEEKSSGGFFFIKLFLFIFREKKKKKKKIFQTWRLVAEILVRYKNTNIGIYINNSVRKQGKNSETIPGYDVELYGHLVSISIYQISFFLSTFSAFQVKILVFRSLFEGQA